MARITPPASGATGTSVPVTRTVNGHELSADVTVSKGDVGLGNVDNTSDANKPVSTAQAAADAAVLAASQPLDSDLTAIAALSTTSFGRALLALADAAAGRTAFGLGTAATHDTGDYQPIDSDLTAIAALTTTSYGRAFLALADAAAARTALALGTASTVNTGTASGDVPLLSTGGVLPIGRLATGTPDGTKFVRDDGTLAAASGAMSLIASTVLGSSAASIVFSSIPGTYKHLRVVAQARCDAAGTLATMALRLNADTGSNYNYAYQYGTGSTSAAVSSAGTAFILGGSCPGAGGTANRGLVWATEIPNYAATTLHKGTITVADHFATDTTSDFWTFRIGGLWKNTAAVTSITYYLTGGDNFVAGTTVSLYGMS